MVKTGFRGERKGNPHPVHILSYSETSPKERGSVATEKIMKPPPSPLGEGELVAGKGRKIRELANLEISKWGTSYKKRVSKGEP